MSRWWIYQRERFPVISHSALIAAFSLSAVCYSRLRRGAEGFPDLHTAIVAFVCSFLLFLQLRIADEFKDAAEDAQFRPYRPVPRGLVSLKELGWIACGAGAIQLALAVSLSPSLSLLLFLCWAYMGLMTREFFVPAWLKAHPFHYLWTHMIILPVMDLYVTACDWQPTGRIPRGLGWLLLVSFLNGVVIEIGRKLRAPADEEAGVDTYSRLWGMRGASAAWFGAMVLTGACAWQAARIVHFGGALLGLVSLLLASAAIVLIRFLGNPEGGAGKRVETMSGIWSILLYLSIGLAPLGWENLRR
ncbi:MAG: UbiA family prenyltransferase [Acidobacteriaceae bacterium]|nr:UbiA family prenyltransferase [Acidobacteriaceae bacterium]